MAKFADGVSEHTLHSASRVATGLVSIFEQTLASLTDLRRHPSQARIAVRNQLHFAHAEAAARWSEEPFARGGAAGA